MRFDKVSVGERVCMIKFANMRHSEKEKEGNKGCKRDKVSGNREYDTRPQEEYNAFIEMVDKEIRYQLKMEDL